MFRKNTPNYQLLLQEELEQQLKLLKTHVSSSDEFVKTLSYVERLYAMTDHPSSVSRDTIATIGANLLGILMIIKHENVGNFISSKALSFVIRPR